MSAVWTLEYNGTEKTLAAWGLKGLKRERKILEADALTFVHAGADFDADPLFPFESTIKVYRTENGTRVKWFEGAVLEPDRSLSGGAEGMGYTVAGPWYWLNRVFLQEWKSWDNALQQLVTVRKSHVMLGLDTDGDLLTVKEAIEAALDFAIANGASLQYSIAASLDQKVPLYEAKDIAIPEVGRILLRWFPDTVTWFDYTTTPPTLHIARRADLTPVTLPATAANGGDTRSVKIKARRDLQRSAVVIIYEQASSVNGELRLITSVDKYPANATGLEFKALVVTVNLQGYAVTVASAELTTQAINLASQVWWEEKLPWLTEADMLPFTQGGYVISAAARQSALANELLDGQIAPWMNKQSARDTITANVHWRKADGSEGDRKVSVRVVATDAATGSYSGLTAVTSGEAVPVGLAQKVYTALNTLHYEGDLEFVEAEVSGLAGIGNVLNLSGGRAEWAAMNAMVWAEMVDVDAGVTQIRIGPAENLGIPDLVQLLQVDRNRFSWTNPAAFTNADMGNASELELGEGSPMENSQAGVDTPRRLVVTGPTVNNKTARIDMNLDPNSAGSTKPPAAAAGKTLSVKEVNVCVRNADGTSTQKRMLVLGSDLY